MRNSYCHLVFGWETAALRVKAFKAPVEKQTLCSSSCLFLFSAFIYPEFFALFHVFTNCSFWGHKNNILFRKPLQTNMNIAVIIFHRSLSLLHTNFDHHLLVNHVTRYSGGSFTELIHCRHTTKNYQEEEEAQNVHRPRGHVIRWRRDQPSSRNVFNSNICDMFKQMFKQMFTGNPSL